METIHLGSWEEFEDKLKKDKEKTPNKDLYGKPYGSVSPLLFRGQADANWILETTLERECRERGLFQEWPWELYIKVLDKVRPAFTSQINKQYDSPRRDYKIIPCPHPPPGYNLMIDLRHHNFPSPLLDWTKNYHIAAYFAFEKEPQSDRVAIYSFRDFAGYQKTSDSFGPWIWVPEAYGRENQHPRHDSQQAKHTICYKTVKEGSDEKPKGNVYCVHEKASFGSQQDILLKYTLPVDIRNEVLNKLRNIDINDSILFVQNGDLSVSQRATEILKKETDRIFKGAFLETLKE
ncbi:MAG: FRG domain-containing protein [Nitrospinota bacterium]|nr:FRG domain-containing protein [Nitrospinota bacterium]